MQSWSRGWDLLTGPCDLMGVGFEDGITNGEGGADVLGELDELLLIVGGNVGWESKEYG